MRPQSTPITTPNRQEHRRGPMILWSVVRVPRPLYIKSNTRAPTCSVISGRPFPLLGVVSRHIPEGQGARAGAAIQHAGRVRDQGRIATFRTPSAGIRRTVAGGNLQVDRVHVAATRQRAARSPAAHRRGHRGEHGGEEEDRGGSLGWNDRNRPQTTGTRRSEFSAAVVHAHHSIILSRRLSDHQ